MGGLVLAVGGMIFWGIMLHLAMGYFHSAIPAPSTNPAWEFTGERESGLICHNNSTGERTTCSTVWTTPQLWGPGCDGVTAQDQSVCTENITVSNITDWKCVALLVHAEHIHFGIGSAGDCHPAQPQP